MSEIALTHGAHHIGLTVPDLAQTRTFFTDALGFRQVGEQPDLLSTPEMVHNVSLSPGGRYLVITFGESLGGSKIIILDATSGRPLLGMRG